MITFVTIRWRTCHLLGLPVLLAIALWATPSWGQVSPDSVHHRNNCRLARQVLVHGKPANKRAWALAYFVTCGAEGGTIVRDVLIRHRGDASFEPTLDEFVTAATGLVDGEVAATALGVASDRTAGRVARIQALRLLYGQVVPLGNVSYERIIRSGNSFLTHASGNTVGYVEPLDAGGGHGPIYFGSPLSDVEIATIGEAVSAVADDMSNPVAVRTAAAHVAGQYRTYRICPRTTPGPECVRRMRERYILP
jgi:hypothetical protein